MGTFLQIGVRTFAGHVCHPLSNFKVECSYMKYVSKQAQEGHHGVVKETVAEVLM